MLNAMRQGAKSGIMKFILFGFMALAVGGLVLMDVGGVFRGGVARNSIAEIGGTELPVSVFDRTVRRTLSNQGLDMQTAYKLGFINQILRNEITNNILQKAATDMGLVVGEQAVLKQTNELLEPLVTEDITKKQALAQVLRRQGMTEQDFIYMIRAEMTNTLLRNALQLGTAVEPGSEALDLYQFQNEKRQLEVVLLPHSTVEGLPEPTDEILLPFYQAGKERYAIPETRSFSLAVMSSDTLKETLDVSEEELRDIYERDITTFSKPERRVMEQAIVDSEVTAAAIAESVNQGTALETAVQEQTGSTDAYLGEEAFEQEGLPEEIASRAFAAEPSDVIGPVETALGWHVLKLKEILPPDTEPFETVKDRLRREILELRVADEMFAMAGSIDDALAGGMPLENVAEEMGMEIEQYGPVKADGSTADNKEGLDNLEADKSYILETVFTLLEGETSPVFELADGRYATLRVDSITEKTYKPFEDVRDDLAEVWDQDQKEIANKHRAEDAVQALNNGETTLRELASGHGGRLQTLNLVRSGDVQEPLNNASKTLFFNLPENEYGFAPGQDGFVIGQVTEVTLPDASRAEDEKLASVSGTVRKSAQEEIMKLYFDELFDTYEVKINQRLLETTYGPGSEQF